MLVRNFNFSTPLLLEWVSSFLLFRYSIQIWVEINLKSLNLIFVWCCYGIQSVNFKYDKFPFISLLIRYNGTNFFRHLIPFYISIYNISLFSLRRVLKALILIIFWDSSEERETIFLILSFMTLSCFSFLNIDNTVL